MDDLPVYIKPGKFYIINAINRKDATKSVGHWLVILYYERKIVFVDSLGDQPPCPILKLMLKTQLKTGVDLFYSNVVLQNSISTTCGAHALTFCSLFSLSYNIYEIFFEFYQIQSHNNVLFYYDYYATQFVSYFYHEKVRSIFYSFN